MGALLNAAMANMLGQVTTQNTNQNWEKYRRITPDSVPIPFFGDYDNAEICTIGINPSDTAFNSSTHPCLRSNLKKTTSNIPAWVQTILDYYSTYFYSGKKPNPWFKKLESFLNNIHSQKLSIKSASYKVGASLAVHIDLVPWATTPTWTDLSKNFPNVPPVHLHENAKIFKDLLDCVEKANMFKVIFLNGKAAVFEFCKITGELLATNPSTTIPWVKFIHHGYYKNARVVGWNAQLMFVPPAVLANEVNKYL
jgi:hypothetical protein